MTWWIPPDSHCGQYLGYSQAYQDSCIGKFEKTEPTNDQDNNKVYLVFFSTSSLCSWIQIQFCREVKLCMIYDSSVHCQSKIKGKMEIEVGKNLPNDIIFELENFPNHLPEVRIEYILFLCKQAGQTSSASPFAATAFV